jgi:hypothetical protein
MYQNLLESGQFKNMRELAKLKGVSKPRISQIMSLNNIDIGVEPSQAPDIMLKT